ncbi:MAG: DUF1295 domain-containing protein [Salinisphaera sp.]|nr:DUF1295 domain-containing protein [Salinisphaera sp.]
MAAGLGLVIALAVVTVAWVAQLRSHNAGLVDVFWTAAIGVLALLYALTGDAPPALRLLLALLAGGWALRLAGHLALRMRGAPEDRRYAGLRAAWGSRANLYLLLFFWLQAVVAWVLALPFVVIAYRPDPPGPGWLALAVLIWAVAVAGEATADHQLNRFKRDPANRGKVLDRGLWRYSRHPNYFFETLHWVAYIPLAIGAAYWWVAVASPVVMAWLLLKVSGIPTVESAQGSAQRQGHDDYVRRTSAFIPWPPASRPRQG